MRTLKIYPLRNFQTYNTELLTIVTMLCIIFPGTYNWKFVPLTCFTHFDYLPNPSVSGNHQSVLCI